LTEDSETRLYGFRPAYVWDVSQTDGEPFPEFRKVTGDPSEMTERVQRFITARGITLEYDDRIRPAHGMSAGGRITILPGLDAATEFSVLVHECAHELLHRSERRHQTTHAVRETEAEAVAFVVATGIGLNAGTSASDYIQLHAGDAAILGESLARIQQTAAEIMNELLPLSQPAP
jgi:hypothetical protein